MARVSTLKARLVKKENELLELEELKTKCIKSGGIVEWSSGEGEHSNRVRSITLPEIYSLITSVEREIDNLEESIDIKEGKGSSSAFYAEGSWL